MIAYRFWLHVTVVVFACFSCTHCLICTAAACRRGHGHVPGYTCCKQPDGDYKCCRFRGERQVCCAQAVCPFPDLPKSCCCPEGSHCSMFSLNGCTTQTTSQLFTTTTISSTPSSTKTTEAATTTTALTSSTTTGLVTTSTISAAMSSTTTNSQTQSTTSTGSSSLLTTTTSTASTTTESVSPTTTTATRSSTSLPATTSTTSTIGTSSSTGATTQSSTSTKRSTTSVTQTTSEPGTTSTSPIKTSTSTGTTTSTGSTTTTSTQTTSLPATTSTSTIGTSSSTGSSTTPGSSTSAKSSTTTATQSTSQSATTSSSTTAKSSSTSSSSTPGTSSSTGSSTSTGASTSTGTTASTTSPPADCYGDFLFIVPTSERLAPLIQSMLYIVLNMTTVLGAAQDGSHHALIHYSSPNWKSNVSYDFNTINTYPEIHNYITTQHWEKYVGVSDLDRGLQLGIQDVFTPQGGDRSSAPNFVVLISDGYFDQTSECCPAPFDSASALRRLADIWAVEVGPDTRPENLYKICASSAKVYPAKHSYELAQKILMELMKKCKNISD